MLSLFKGELSYHEITRELIYKEMMALRDARVDQLIEERNASEKEADDNIRNSILAK